MQSVHAAFDDQERAQAAVQALLDVGFPSTDIEVSERKDSQTRDVPVVWQTFALRWGAMGGAIGAVVGAVLGVVIPRAIDDPEVLEAAQMALSENALLGAVQGAFLGAVALGIIGVTIGVGTWRDTAMVDEDADRFWVGVQTNQGDIERATDALRNMSPRQLQQG